MGSINFFLFLLKLDIVFSIQLFFDLFQVKFVLSPTLTVGSTAVDSLEVSSVRITWENSLTHLA